MSTQSTARATTVTTPIGRGDSTVRELPAMPASAWRIVGPGIVGAGVALGSGEFVLWPYIASQVGLVLLWAAILGVITQFFLNMEIERYTLATGETALAGFNRLGRHWGLAFVVMVCFANLWPGWAMGSASLVTYMIGGNARLIAIGSLIVIGCALTLSPVVYIALERLIFVKVAAVLTLMAIAFTVAIDGRTWAALPGALASVGTVPSGIGFALLLGAVAFAGAGGGQNLVQSNWIRDKGFGMGQYVPRLVSPVTGVEQAASAADRYIFPQDAANLARWRRWWRFANVEHALTFMAVTIATIILTSMLSFSTLYGTPGLPDSIAFLNIEGQRLQAAIGGWFGILFWAIGALSLFGTAMGILDYTGRLAADVMKNAYLRHARVSENQLYFWIVWTLVASGAAILLFGLDQPLVLLVISSSVGGFMMCVYSVLLILLNRRELPKPIAITPFRIAVLLWSTAFFGYLAALTIRGQWERLVG